jgi:hypothetical protein
MDSTAMQAEKPGRVRRGFNKLTRKLRSAKSAYESTTSASDLVAGESYPNIEKRPYQETGAASIATEPEKLENEVTNTNSDMPTPSLAPGTPEITPLTPDTFKVSV